MNESKYQPLIKKIQARRRWIIGITIVAVLAIILFTPPWNIEFLGEEILDFKGLHPALIVTLVIFCFLFEIIAYASVSLPVYTSMDQECDPEKHLVLNKNLNKEKNIAHIYAVDYLYLGYYAASINYAEQMIKSGSEQMVLVGLFNKARGEFLLGNYESFKKAVEEYQSKLASNTKRTSKSQAMLQKINTLLGLMRAICDNDTETIKAEREKAESWNLSKATEGFVNYIKGLAAYNIGDKQEAIYRFKSVKEGCPKTVFAELSEEHLASLRD